MKMYLKCVLLFHLIFYSIQLYCIFYLFFFFNILKRAYLQVYML